MKSIRAFMEHIIDYAGLFPPASLTLEPAIRNYAAYQSCTDSWMLGRFILPATQINELQPYVSLFSQELPLPLSVIGRKSNQWNDCYRELLADLQKIADFRDQFGNQVKIGVIELPLPPIQVDREWLEVIGQETAEKGLQTFCELTFPRNEEWERNIVKMLDAISAHNSAEGVALGVKLRTGGVTADAFPTPDQVATVLMGCRDRGIAMKFTAGLHHPIRMHREEVNARMHGFVNVFAAGMLSAIHQLDHITTAQILDDEDTGSFSFGENDLSWRGISINTQEIIQLRKTGLCAFGSCSFDEPREDLRVLNLL